MASVGLSGRAYDKQHGNKNTSLPKLSEDLQAIEIENGSCSWLQRQTSRTPTDSLHAAASAGFYNVHSRRSVPRQLGFLSQQAGLLRDVAQSHIQKVIIRTFENLWWLCQQAQSPYKQTTPSSFGRRVMISLFGGPSTAIRAALCMGALWLPGDFCEFAVSAAANVRPQGQLQNLGNGWLPSELKELRDVIGPPSPDVPYVQQKAIHALFFGDSNDRNIVNDFCVKAEPQPPRHEVETLRECWHGNLTLAWQPLIGVHPEGPYWQNLKGTPPERLKHGLQAQLRTFQAPPDLVTLSSNIWDLWHWASTAPALLVNKQIEETQLRNWQAHVSEILSQIEVHPSHIAASSACDRLDVTPCMYEVIHVKARHVALMYSTRLQYHHFEHVLKCMHALTSITSSHKTAVT